MEINKIPTVKLVFDRKHVASKTNKGLVQLEVTYKRKRKWISANVKLYKDQWDDRLHAVRTPDSIEINEWLNGLVLDLEKWLRDKTPFDWDKLEIYLNESKEPDDFISFLEKAINGRNDIRKSTRKNHRKLLNILKEYGNIEKFSDLTPTKILGFDNWLHGRKIRKVDANGNDVYVPMKQQSIYGYHKMMRTYINLGIATGKIQSSPYTGLRFQKGESEHGRYLTMDELSRIETAPMHSGSVARARDLFVFQAYTGLAYADLAAFDFTKAEKSETGYVYSGKRVKTGEQFYFVLLEPALHILYKYNKKLPVIAGQSYNSMLKKVAKDAGINKPISSHWARRTAGMMMLNAGIRVETVAKILGHGSIKTTEQFYASISKETVEKEMRKAGL